MVVITMEIDSQWIRHHLVTMVTTNMGVPFYPFHLGRPATILTHASNDDFWT